MRSLHFFVAVSVMLAQDTKEKPIIFSGPMVRAILAGRKTQTRRVVHWPDRVDPEELGPVLAKDPQAFCNKLAARLRFRSPYGKIGDRLWVRETWSPLQSQPASIGGVAVATQDLAIFEADGAILPPEARWHSSIHLPRYLSRLLLEITDLRVERLQGLSLRDALAEGLEPAKDAEARARGEAVNDWYHPGGWAGPTGDARLVFADLWDSINARRGFGWKTNPWVWALEFRRL